MFTITSCYTSGGGSSSNNSSASHQSSSSPSPAGSQQYLSSNSSGVSSFMGGSGSNRRESREAETQFVDHPSSLGGGPMSMNMGGPTSIASGTGSPHNSLEYSLININGSIVGGIGSERQRDLAVSAVVLDEWLKELAAITQEQCIIMISDQVISQKQGKTS